MEELQDSGDTQSTASETTASEASLSVSPDNHRFQHTIAASYGSNSTTIIISGAVGVGLGIILGQRSGTKL